MNTWCHSISVTFKFWCWVPRESVLRGSSVHKATRTVQNLKVTLIEWLLKLTLLEWHQVFRPLLPYPAMLVVHPLFDHAEDWPYWDDAREINEVVNSMARSQRGVLSDYCFSFLMTHSSDILSCSTINPVTPSAQSKAQWLGRKDSASLIVVKSNPKTTC